MYLAIIVYKSIGSNKTITVLVLYLLKLILEQRGVNFSKSHTTEFKLHAPEHSACMETVQRYRGKPSEMQSCH